MINALDEYERQGRKDDVRVVLRLLAKAKDLSTIQLRIFLISRTEIPIDDEFNVISKLTFQDFILYQISNDIIEHDILTYLSNTSLNRLEGRVVSCQIGQRRKTSTLLYRMLMGCLCMLQRYVDSLTDATPRNSSRLFSSAWVRVLQLFEYYLREV